jgi:hypothetical protein
MDCSRATSGSKDGAREEWYVQEQYYPFVWVGMGKLAVVENGTWRGDRTLITDYERSICDVIAD